MTSINDFIIPGESPGDEGIFEEENALAYLLTEGYVAINSRQYLESFHEPEEKYRISKNSTIVVFVNVNDKFGPGSDAEDVSSDDGEPNIETNELYRLTLYVTKNERWGSVKFVCWKRNLQPWKPIVREMKKDGAWDDFMESLPLNEDYPA